MFYILCLELLNSPIWKFCSGKYQFNFDSAMNLLTNMEAMYIRIKVGRWLFGDLECDKLRCENRLQVTRYLKRFFFCSKWISYLICILLAEAVSVSKKVLWKTLVLSLHAIFEVLNFWKLLETLKMTDAHTAVLLPYKEQKSAFFTKLRKKKTLYVWRYSTTSKK